MPPSPLTTIVRNVVASNNVGVALLTQGCYKQAAETFHDVLKILRASMVHPSLQEIVDITAATNLYYNVAIQRLRRPEPCQHHENFPYQLNIVSWRSVTSDCYSHDQLEHSSNTGCGSELSKMSPRLYPFRIEDVDIISGEWITEVDGETSLAHVQELFKIESSIIMHNFGLAHMCMAESIKFSSFSNSSNTILSNQQSMQVDLHDPHVNTEMKNNILASRLFSMSASLCFEDTAEECIANYSVSSDGSVLLQYLISNIQSFMIAVSQGRDQARQQMLDLNLLCESVQQMNHMVYTIKQWNTLFSLYVSKPSKKLAVNVTTVVSDPGAVKSMSSLNKIAPAA
jgi:hypothetical protein